MESSERPSTDQRRRSLAQSDDFDLVLNTSQITTSRRIDVLHVDDDESILDLSATLLEKNHGLLSIHSKLDAKEALDYLETNDIDYIVSDYDMPGLNGIADCLINHIPRYHSSAYPHPSSTSTTSSVC